MVGGETAPMDSARAVLIAAAAPAKAAPLCRKKRRCKRPLPATGSPNSSPKLRSFAIAPSQGLFRVWIPQDYYRENLTNATSAPFCPYKHHAGAWAPTLRPTFVATFLLMSNTIGQ